MLIDEVISLAKEAGRMMSGAQDIEVMDKDSKNNHVTNMDLAVQRFLRENLLNLLPGSSFVGEEEDYADRSCNEYWIVDPIDGTTNFIRRLPLSVTSIALVRDQEVILAVVYNPFTDELFQAEKGEGAFRNGKRIRVSDKKIENSIFSTSWGAYDKEFGKKSFIVSEKMYDVCEDIRRLGSAAYELCKMGMGSIDVYFEPILYPWDHAASSLVLTEAGGCISGLEGPASLRARDTVIAANNEENLRYLKKVVSEVYKR